MHSFVTLGCERPYGVLIRSATIRSTISASSSRLTSRQPGRAPASIPHASSAARSISTDKTARHSRRRSRYFACLARALTSCSRTLAETRLFRAKHPERSPGLVAPDNFSPPSVAPKPRQSREACLPAIPTACEMVTPRAAFVQSFGIGRLTREDVRRSGRSILALDAGQRGSRIDASFDHEPQAVCIANGWQTMSDHRRVDLAEIVASSLLPHHEDQSPLTPDDQQGTA